MTRSVYIIGGAGAGKSTFTQQVLDEILVMDPEPLTELHSKRNAKALVTLRGHHVTGIGMLPGIYLGVLREGNHPGTDGLDRASHQPCVEWLETGELPAWIIGEGYTLANPAVLQALHQHTELLLVHLHVNDRIRAWRFDERGTDQNPRFVKTTVSASANRLREMQELGADALDIDTSDPIAWDLGIDLVRAHLLHRT